MNLKHWQMDIQVEGNWYTQISSKTALSLIVLDGLDELRLLVRRFPRALWVSLGIDKRVHENGSLMLDYRAITIYIIFSSKRMKSLAFVIGIFFVVPHSVWCLSAKNAISVTITIRQIPQYYARPLNSSSERYTR